jgi:Protein of unknown function (DUF2950)
VSGFIANLKMEGNIMLHRFSSVAGVERKLVRLVASAVFGVSVSCLAVPIFGQQPGQRTFTSAEEAGSEFFAAMQGQDEKAPLRILGPAGKDVLSSGDPEEDSDARVGFVTKYQEMHRFVIEPDGKVTLIIGAENWPFPIPLANNHGTWYFDTSEGRGEILFRRIGKNEVAAMDALRDLVEAQQQYFTRAPAGDPKQYAQKLVSDEGGHNGLYWQGAADEADSPINPLIAYARQNLPTEQVGQHVPFNGYMFRILKSQGRHAPGGAKKYIIDGKMSAGFAVVAYPVEYRSSGVMTFIVDKSGTIYEKDLGPDTTKLAQTMTVYDPDSTWHKAE